MEICGLRLIFFREHFIMKITSENNVCGAPVKAGENREAGWKSRAGPPL